MSAAPPHAHPRFVTFEGVDGAGKSTHVAWFAETLAARSGTEVVVTREPGGSDVGEALRELVLRHPMDLETEALLMFASRRQHLAERIVPALARGAWVVCDRFTDATYAYQGGGRGLDRRMIDDLARWVHPTLVPGRTLLFDLDPETARARREGSRHPDRFESEAQDFFVRVRAAYLAIAAAEPARVRVVDGAKSIAEVRNILEEEIVSLCSKE